MPRQTSTPSLPTARQVLGVSAVACLLALGGCATPVNLNQPVPVQNITPVPTPSAPASTYAPVTPQAPPPSEARPIAPGAPITVQPLGPQTAPMPAASSPAAINVPAPTPAPSTAPVPAPTPAPGASNLPPGAVRYSCEDGSSFVATYGDVSVTLITALGQLTLDQTVSADGARYKNSAFQVWFKGRDATVTNFLQNSTTTCHQQ